MACPIATDYSSLRTAITETPFYKRPSSISKMIYLSSNEERIEHIREELFKSSIRGGLYLGVAGLENWNILSIVEPDLALLVDFNARVVDLQYTVIHLILFAKTRLEFIGALKQHLEKNPEKFTINFRFQKTAGEPANRESLTKEIDLACSCLYGAFSTDLAFQRVKKLVSENRVLAFALDLRDPDPIAHLKSLITLHKATLSLMYISNIGDWLHLHKSCDDPELQAFTHNINTLIDPKKTHLIESSWFGQLQSKYHNYGHQIVVFLLHPLRGNPYDPCILRGSLKPHERRSYFSHTPHLLDLSFNASSKHWHHEKSLKKPRMQDSDS